MSVKYSFEDHIVNRQYEAEQEMLKEFEAGNYTIANPLVKYNAYLVNPLSAVVCFHTAAAGLRPYNPKKRHKAQSTHRMYDYSDFYNKVLMEQYSKQLSEMYRCVCSHNG